MKNLYTASPYRKVKQVFSYSPNDKQNNCIEKEGYKTNNNIIEKIIELFFLRQFFCPLLITNIFELKQLIANKVKV